MVKEQGKGFHVVRSSEKHKLETGSYACWMWENTDEENGFIFYGEKKLAPLYQYMAGGFHYMFNHEAELQTALPGKILTTKPLRLVLDRSPFI